MWSKVVGEGGGGQRLTIKYKALSSPGRWDPAMHLTVLTLSSGWVRWVWSEVVG